MNGRKQVETLSQRQKTHWNMIGSAYLMMILVMQNNEGNNQNDSVSLPACMMMQQQIRQQLISTIPFSLSISLSISGQIFLNARSSLWNLLSSAAARSLLNINSSNGSKRNLVFLRSSGSSLLRLNKVELNISWKMSKLFSLLISQWVMMQFSQTKLSKVSLQVRMKDTSPISLFLCKISRNTLLLMVMCPRASVFVLFSRLNMKRTSSSPITVSSNSVRRFFYFGRFICFISRRPSQRATSSCLRGSLWMLMLFKTERILQHSVVSMTVEKRQKFERKLCCIDIITNKSRSFNTIIKYRHNSLFIYKSLMLWSLDQHSFAWNDMIYKLIMTKNVLGTPLKMCCNSPMTGFYRDGYCNSGPFDYGKHFVCAEVTPQFLQFSKQRGNDLTQPAPQYGFPGLSPGDRWCLCAMRWLEAHHAGVAPHIDLEASHQKLLEYISLEELKNYEIAHPQ